MLVGLQLVVSARTPPNVTVLEPWLEPKLDPVIVTTAPTVPDLIDNPEIVGLDPLLVLTTAEVSPAPSIAEVQTTENGPGPELVGKVHIGLPLLEIFTRPAASTVSLTGVPGATGKVPGKF